MVIYRWKDSSLSLKYLSTWSQTTYNHSLNCTTMRPVYVSVADKTITLNKIRKKLILCINYSIIAQFYKWRATAINWLVSLWIPPGLVHTDTDECTHRLTDMHTVCKHSHANTQTWCLPLCWFLILVTVAQMVDLAHFPTHLCSMTFSIFCMSSYQMSS